MEEQGCTLSQIASSIGPWEGYIRLKCVRSYYIQISCHVHLASPLLDPTRILSYGFGFSDYFSSQENFNLILITCIEFCLQGQIKKLALQGQALSSSTVCLGTVIFPRQMPQYCSNSDLELLLMKWWRHTETFRW